MYIQDAYFTYNQGDAFKVDAGMIMVPLGHNHNQSAATLLPVDYGPYTFLEVVAHGRRVGRDYGVQLRGYPPKQHLEYRLGVFQGVRGAEAPQRVPRGGPRRLVPLCRRHRVLLRRHLPGEPSGCGRSAPASTPRRATTPTPPTCSSSSRFNEGEHGLTAQVNWMRFDGGDVPRRAAEGRTSIEVEAGFHFVQGEDSRRWCSTRSGLRQSGHARPEQRGRRASAYWMAGHQRNIKVTAGQQHTDGQPDRTQVLVQLQLFYF